MIINIDINNITGSSPYSIFICQTAGSSCYYITQISSTPYSFTVPPPINNENSFLLKIIDNDGCEIYKSVLVPT